MSRRSASDLPASPVPEALRSTSWECRAARVSAHHSRGARKGESERRGVAIAELQRELVALEADLADEARTQSRLHAFNTRHGGVIRELEVTGDAMVGLIDGMERQSGSGLVVMVLRLMEQARRWRRVKPRAAALAAEAAEASSPTTQTGGQR